LTKLRSFDVNTPITTWEIDDFVRTIDLEYAFWLNRCVLGLCPLASDGVQAAVKDSRAWRFHFRRWAGKLEPGLNIADKSCPVGFEL
jgi:hypothetical protein